MHELSIASELLRLVEEAATEAGATRVISVGLRLGECCGVVQEALEFALESVVIGSLAEGAAFVIEFVPARLACEVCARPTTPLLPHTMRCGECGQLAPELAQGRELELVRIECE